MVIREVQDRDFIQLAEMRWTHAVEDDETYGEHNTDGITKSVFIEEFIAFLYTNKEYKIFVAEDEYAKILSAMFVYLIFRQFPPRMQSVNLLPISQRCSRLKNIVVRASVLDCSIM